MGISISSNGVIWEGITNLGSSKWSGRKIKTGGTIYYGTMHANSSKVASDDELCLHNSVYRQK